jgi:hypothetical protein
MEIPHDMHLSDKDPLDVKGAFPWTGGLRSRTAIRF